MKPPCPLLQGATVYTQVVAARVSGFIDPLNGHYERSEVIALSSSFCDCVVVPPRCGQGLGAMAQQDS